jgi:hypothetical protein
VDEDVNVVLGVCVCLFVCLWRFLYVCVLVLFVKMCVDVIFLMCVYKNITMVLCIMFLLIFICR